MGSGTFYSAASGDDDPKQLVYGWGMPGGYWEQEAYFINIGFYEMPMVFAEQTNFHSNYPDYPWTQYYGYRVDPMDEESEWIDTTDEEKDAIKAAYPHFKAKTESGSKYYYSTKSTFSAGHDFTSSVSFRLFGERSAGYPPDCDCPVTVSANYDTVVEVSECCTTVNHSVSFIASHPGESHFLSKGAPLYYYFSWREYIASPYNP